jgi:hypothetical protein
MVIGKYLKEVEGFNLRERLNIYGGMALGALIPTAIIKYALTASGAINPQNTLGEILSWGISAIGSMPFTVAPISTIAGGLTVGYLSARDLKHKRHEKERKRESKLEQEI